MSRRMAKALRHLPDLGVEGLLLLQPALLAQTSRWSPTPTTTTSFSIPACVSSGGGSVTRPLASSSISKELPW